MQKAFITGLSGPELTQDERTFLARERPAGLILFTRNCVNKAQIRALVAAFKSAVGTPDVLVLIDQEGGRVQRLRPPISRQLPPAASFADLLAKDSLSAAEATRLIARLTADDLTELDINTNCAPVLDVPVPGAHAIIGDRAYGDALDGIIRLGRAVAAGLMDGGVLPVMKHIPGHGRAMADSHLELPIVDAPRSALQASDLVPFTALADLPAAMTAHVVFTDLDPSQPASTSLSITRDIIRGRIGFYGLLMSDDLSMKALTGTFQARTHATFAAGSDLALHCNGDIAEMQAVAAASPLLHGMAQQRFARALTVTKATRKAFDRVRAETLLNGLLPTTA